MSTIKISDLATSSLVLTNYLMQSDTSGTAYKNTFQELSNFLSTVGSVSFKGDLAIADTPASDGFYFASESGTFTNAGSLVVDLTNGLSVIIVSGTVTIFDQVVIPLTQPTVSTVLESNTTIAVNGKGVYDEIYDIDISDRIVKIDGEYLTDTGTVTNASFEVYDYIKIPKSGSLYIDATVLAGTFNIIQIYNKYKEPIENILATTITYSKFEIIPSNVAESEFIRFSHRKANDLNVFIDREVHSADVFEVNDVEVDENLFDKDLTWVDNFYLNASGENQGASGWSVTDFIEVAELFRITGEFTGGSLVRRLAFYDSSFSLLSATTNLLTTTFSYREVDVPTNTKYIKLSTQTAVKDTVILYIDVSRYLNLIESVEQPSDLLLSTFIDVVEGKQFNLFLDNLTVKPPLTDNYNLLLDSSSPLVRKSKHYQFTPGIGAADFSPVASVYNNNVQLLSSKTTTIRTHANSGGTGTKNVLLIGDSLTDLQTLPTNVKTLLDADVDVTFNQIGTRGDVTGKHEGRASWRWEDYIKGDVYSGSSNAFWIGGQLDFSAYIVDNGFSGLDYVIINLGTNDVKQGSELISDFDINAIIADAKTFIDVIISDFPSCKIAIVLPSLGSPIFLGDNNALFFRTSMAKLCLKYLEEFDDAAYNANVTTLSMNLWIDRGNSYPFTTEAISSIVTATGITITDAIHPLAIGYAQKAQSYYAKIRAWVSGTL